MSNHIQTVQKIYEAFGKGDIPTILSFLAEDVRWEDWSTVGNSAQKAGVPWLKSLTGRDHVVEFFQAIGGFKFHEFNIGTLMAGGNQVAVDLKVDFEIPETGTRLKDEEMHLWTFNDAGQVTRFRHYADTAKHMQAAHATAVS